jgi:alpha-mannosidase
MSAGICLAQPTQPDRGVSRDFCKDKVLYLVGYAHLDTQWRWSYPQVIAEFLRKTMEDNFKLFDKYPHYVFNFTGANRYMMMKEYFPEDFAKLKWYVAHGRWFPAGSSMEEGDANMPSGEALIRQVLYGNEFFRKEFGTASAEFMLPDCFGFQASLPSVLAHCGIKGFSTQKLTWGSAVGVPFNVGVWVGPDGKSVVAALNPLSYTSDVKEDMSASPMWIKRLEEDGAKTGLYVDYHYYGTGDRGGAPKEESVAWVEKSVNGTGPIKVISSKADQMFLDLSSDQIAKLPKYQGDLLLTNHSAGSLTSQAYVKRLNRKAEELAAGAEAASVAADWLGSASYPREKLFEAWRLILGAHFHDTMAGTMLPKAYEYTWNNMTLAMNQFAAVEEDACGAVIKGMDTRNGGKGSVSVVVFNPLSIDREDVVEAAVTFAKAPKTATVSGPDGKGVASQLIDIDGNTVHLLFRADVAAMGFAAYTVEPEDAYIQDQDKSDELKLTDRSLENRKYRVTLSSDGDIASIFDKQNNREVLSSPMQLQFLHENPEKYPAWNMDWSDRQKPPKAVVSGPAKVEIAEWGTVRGSLKVTREGEGSRFVQFIRLASGEAGDRIEVENHIDWQTEQSSLKAAFPLKVSNENATYESQTAAVPRSTNNEKKFEVPQQKWFDLDDADGSYGVGIINDSKYGSDKPNDHTVRLTLLYTPQADLHYQDQATQDIGRHEMFFAIAPHAGTWADARMPGIAARLNRPLVAFVAPAHDGVLGTHFSMVKCSNDQLEIIALKKAEEGGRTIIRVNELTGRPALQAELSFDWSHVVAADEVDGQERQLRPANVKDGKIVFDIEPFGLRTFSIELASPGRSVAQDFAPPVTQPVALDYNLDAVSSHEHLSDGGFDSDARTYPVEGLPEKIVSEGITFKMGSFADGAKNAVECDGQDVAIPDGFEKVYLLAAAVDGDQTGDFGVGGKSIPVKVQDWGGYVGQWDKRVWRGVVPALTYDWKNKYAGLEPGYVKTDTVAWYSSHRHHPQNGNEYYRYCYLFKYGLDLPAGAKSLTLPKNENVRIFAMTVAKSVHDDVLAGTSLYDTLEDHVQNIAPVISPAGGKFAGNVTITIAHPLYWRDGNLHYTTDGSEVTEKSSVYSGPVVLSASAKVRAREIDGGVNSGPEATAQFEISPTASPDNQP